ncbi:MAG TPA: hypothetical protein VKB57_15285 [Acidimicrobiales bacterium]|nr:hypothetical protein [Acidimicrobiales bacterium]
MAVAASGDPGEVLFTVHLAGADVHGSDRGPGTQRVGAGIDGTCNFDGP